MMPCFKRTNFKHLVSGYCRTRFETKYTPDSIADLILCYFAQFHGTTFEWKISNNYISEQLENLESEENEDPQTHNNIFCDSDVFDVGLANRFFLRIWGNDKSGAKTTASHGTNKKKRNNNNDENRCKFIISLRSFALTSKISNVLFHTELYLHRIHDNNNLESNSNNIYNNRKEHSTIWKISKNCRSPQSSYSFHWVVGDSKKIINFLRGGNESNDLKFIIECKIKILRICQDNKYYLENDCSSLEKIHPTTLNSNNDRLRFRFSWILNSSNICINQGDEIKNDQEDEYHSGIFYDIFQLQCNNKGEFSLMICGLPYKTHKMGIKFDLYVKCNNKNSNNRRIRSQVASSMLTFDYDNLTKHYFCKNTNKRIKDLLFKYDSVTLICDINVIQRYDDKNNEIVTIKKKISSKTETKTTTNINTCTGDLDSNSIEIVNKQQSVISNSICNNVEMEEKYYEKYNITFPHLIKEKKLSSNKIVSKFATDMFIWCIDNLKIINDLSRNDGTNNLYESEVFKLHKHGWSLSIGKESKTSDIILIRAWCLCSDDSITQSKSQLQSQSKSKSNKTPKNSNSNPKSHEFTIAKIDTSCELATCFYSVRIDFIEAGVNHRYFTHPCQPGKTFSLRFPINQLKKLKPSKITMRFSVSLIDVSKFFSPPPSSSIGDDDDHDKQTEKYKCKELVEFENWLVEVVKLPQYLNQFKKHALTDLNVIRLVSGQDLIDAGVKKIGHKLKFLKHIAILNNQNKNENEK